MVSVIPDGGAKIGTDQHPPGSRFRVMPFGRNGGRYEALAQSAAGLKRTDIRRRAASGAKPAPL